MLLCKKSLRAFAILWAIILIGLVIILGFKLLASLLTVFGAIAVSSLYLNCSVLN